MASDPRRHSTELKSPLEAFRSLHWKKHRIVFKVYEELSAIAIVGEGERQPQSRSNIYRRLERLAAQGKLAESVLATLRGFSSRQASASAEWTSALCYYIHVSLRPAKIPRRGQFPGPVENCVIDDCLD